MNNLQYQNVLQIAYPLLEIAALLKINATMRLSCSTAIKLNYLDLDYGFTGNIGRMAGIGTGRGPMYMDIPVEPK